MSDVYPILLSGPPASGKSSLTKALVALDSSFALVRKVKDSREGALEDYDIVLPNEFDAMIQDGQFLQWNERYGRRYGVTTLAVERILQQGKFPIIHAGRYAALKCLREKMPGSASVLLWVNERTLTRRLAVRHAGDPVEMAAKLPAFREELQDLMAEREPLDFDIVFKNNGNDSFKAAQKLRNHLFQWKNRGKPVRQASQIAHNLVLDCTKIRQGLKSIPNRLTIT